MGIALWIAAAGFGLAAFAWMLFASERTRLVRLTLMFLLFRVGILPMLWLRSPM